MAAAPGTVALLLLVLALAVQYLAAAAVGALVSVIWVALPGASLSLWRGHAWP